MKKINHVASKMFFMYAQKNLAKLMTYDKEYHKVRDHYTGKYRDIAQQICI